MIASRGISFSQFVGVAEVSGPSGRFLVSNQLLAPNQINGNPVYLSCNPMRPRHFEFDPRDGGDQINSIGWRSQLHDLVRLAEILSCQATATPPTIR